MAYEKNVKGIGASSGDVISSGHTPWAPYRYALWPQVVKATGPSLSGVVIYHVCEETGQKKVQPTEPSANRCPSPTKRNPHRNLSFH